MRTGNKTGGKTNTGTGTGTGFSGTPTPALDFSPEFRAAAQAEAERLQLRLAFLSGLMNQPVTVILSVEQAKRGPGRPAKQPSAQVWVRNEPASTSTPAAAPAKRKHVNPSRQIQGRYLSLLRQVQPNRRAKFSRMAKEQGREAAIVEMRKALGIQA